MRVRNIQLPNFKIPDSLHNRTADGQRDVSSLVVQVYVVEESPDDLLSPGGSALGHRANDDVIFEKL